MTLIFEEHLRTPWEIEPSAPLHSFHGQANISEATPMKRHGLSRKKPYSRKARSAAVMSVDRYRDDPLYPQIVRAIEPILSRGKVVAPVDVLVNMGLLDPAKLEDWRFGREPYLEKVINCNLTKLSRLLRILHFHAHDLNLTPSTTTYMCWGSGPKWRLRFTKTGDRKLEKAYSRHFVWPGKGPFHPPARRRDVHEGEGRAVQEQE